MISVTIIFALYAILIGVVAWRAIPKDDTGDYFACHGGRDSWHFYEGKPPCPQCEAEREERAHK